MQQFTIHFFFFNLTFIMYPTHVSLLCHILTNWEVSIMLCRAAVEAVMKLINAYLKIRDSQHILDLMCVLEDKSLVDPT